MAADRSLLSLLRSIEDACGDFQVPATRVAAEQVLQQFRAKATVDSARFVLENTGKPQVQFEAASALKEAVIRQWSLMTPEQLDEVQRYTIAFVLHHAAGLATYVREQLLLVVAVIVKGAWMATYAARMGAMINDLVAKYQQAQHGDVPTKYAIAALFLAVVKEFSSTKASALGFTWEYHFQCRRGFETEALAQVFMFALNVLNDLLALPPTQLQQQGSLFNACIGLAELILQWEFTGSDARKFAGSFAKADNDDSSAPPSQVLLRPPVTWRSIFLSSASIVEMFFKLHEVTRRRNSGAHQTIQCLIQLASLSGPIYADAAARISYASVVIQGVLHLSSTLNSAQDVGQELLGLSQIIKRVILNFKLAALVHLPNMMTFMSQVQQVTLFALSKSSSEVDDTWYLEAFDELLEAWTSIWSEVSTVYGSGGTGKLSAPANSEHFKSVFDYDAIADATVQIFEMYITTRLASNNGDGAGGGGGSGDGDVNYNDEDQMVFEDQLVAVAALGRARPGKTLGLLAQLIQERSGLLHFLFQTYKSTGQIAEDQLNATHESLHWLVLLSGHVLADAGSSEKVLVPAPILSVSIAAEKRNSNQPEVVVALTTHIFNLLELVSIAPNQPELVLSSPLLAQTLMWFLERWSQTFLFIDASDYARMSTTLINSYGAVSEASKGLVAGLLSKTLTQFVNWHTDQNFLHELIGVTKTWAKKSNLATAVVQSEPWPAFINAVMERHLVVPDEEQSALIEAICRLCSAAHSSGTSTYLQGLLGIAANRYVATLQRPNFQQVALQPPVIAQVSGLLEMFRGLVMASDASNWSVLFNFCKPYMESFVTLLDFYRSAPETANYVLNFFSCFVGSQINFMSTAECNYTYELVTKLIQTYSKGKVQYDASTEEDRLSDLLTLLKLLSNLISRDFLDFSEGNVYAAEVFVHPEPGQVAVSDVVFYGLSIVIPLVPVKLLHFPALCEQFFKLVVFMCEIYPEKLVSLPPALFTMLVQSLEFGIDHHVAEIAHMSLQAVTGMGDFVVRETAQKGPDACVSWRPVLQALLHKLLQMLLYLDFDPVLLEVSSETLFTLVCADYQSYVHYVQQLLASTQDSLRPRLASAFDTLLQTNQIQPILDREHKRRFTANFERFLTDVRGFLRVR